MFKKIAHVQTFFVIRCMEKAQRKIEIIKDWKILGYTEDVTECGHCGRKDLKGTLALEHQSSGEISHFGIICGAKIANSNKKVIEEQLSEVEKENKKLAQAELALSPEQIAFEAYMIEREKYFTPSQTWEERLPILQKTGELGKKANQVKEELKKKYFIKYW